MPAKRAVLDTSVLYSGLRSRQGASYELSRAVARGRVQPVLSVPLVLEYEQTVSRLVADGILTARDVESAIDFLCAAGHLQEIYYGWRPSLPDPDDDFLLELAVAAGCRHIVTFNLRDFRGVEPFGVEAVTPAAFLALLGGSR